MLKHRHTDGQLLPRAPSPCYAEWLTINHLGWAWCGFLQTIIFFDPPDGLFNHLGSADFHKRFFSPTLSTFFFSFCTLSPKMINGRPLSKAEKWWTFVWNIPMFGRLGGCIQHKNKVEIHVHQYTEIMDNLLNMILLYIFFSQCFSYNNGYFSNEIYNLLKRV